jgi:hypothetical protein
LAGESSLSAASVTPICALCSIHHQSQTYQD